MSFNLHFQPNAATAAASIEIAFAVSSDSLADLPGNSERRTGLWLI